MTDFKNKEILKKLDDKAELNSIVCIRIWDNDVKEAALNHMIKKGWICVQNDVCCDGHYVYYLLTFANKDAAASFKV